MAGARSATLLYDIAFDEGGSVKPYKTNIRASSSLTTRGSSPSALLLLVLLFGIGLWQPACAQQPGKFAPAANAPLNTEQVVENLVGMNLKRAQALHAYQGTRIYKVEYRGFPGDRSAEMVVDVTCQSPDRGIHDPVRDWVQADRRQGIQETLAG
jgi:hypothetical protein